MNYQNENVLEIMMEFDDKTQKTINVLKTEYQQIRAGRANPHILDKVVVDYYGTPTPVNQVGNISVSDARCIVVTPWDISVLKELERAILAANIGINPVNDGKLIRLVFPELNEERRKDLVKQIKKMSEESKVAVRNERRDTLEKLKKLKNKGISEDELASVEKDVEKNVTKSIEAIDKMLADKEKDILTI